MPALQQVLILEGGIVIPYDSYCFVSSCFYTHRHNLTTTPYIPLDKPRFSDTEIQIANDETPENVFIINSVGEANKALDYVKKFADDDSSTYYVKKS